MLISNLQHEEELNYPLFYLQACDFLEEGEAAVLIHESSKSKSIDTYKLKHGAFHTFVLLNIGANLIQIAFGAKKIFKTLYYKPNFTDKCIQLVYIICTDANCTQAPSHLENDQNINIKKIQNGALLIQSFLGQSMFEHRFPKKSFQSTLDKEGFPTVKVLKLSLTLEECHKLSPEELWDTVAKEILKSDFANPNLKYLAFFCGTRYSNPNKVLISNEEEILNMTKGHVSLGGGGLALVGTGSLYTWPFNYCDIISSLDSNEKIDTKNFMDFSAMRGTFGACFGTHIGSVIHELGHIFDLGHSPFGIMSRGFEDLHLFFTDINRTCFMLNELAKANKSFVDSNFHKKGLNREFSFSNDKEFFKKFKCKAQWSRSHAVILVRHKWFNNFCDDPKSLVLKGSVLCSENGIRVIELRDAKMNAFHHWEFSDENIPKIFHIPWTQVKKWPESSKIQVIAIDGVGNIMKDCFIEKPL